MDMGQSSSTIGYRWDNIRGLKVNKRNGHYHFEYDHEIDTETAQDLQKEAGFWPEGYGFYGLVVGFGKSHWMCADSCD